MLDRLGKYRIDDVLGTGAMGIVYKAFDVNIERVVALKTIHTDLLLESHGEELLARFKTEAQASGRLAHTGIVTVYDYGEIDRVAYLAMEYVDGAPLNSLLTENVPLSLEMSLSFMRQLLSALQYAHGRGVIHRDIKPSNLIITAEGVLKIADFGIARLDSSNFTQVGSVMGTPNYMSPEQYRGDMVDARTDLFAAGVIFYQLLTGAFPFAGPAAPFANPATHQHNPASTPADSPLPPELNVVIQKALASKPELRYGTASEFLAAIDAAVRPDSASAPATHNKTLDHTLLAVKTLVVNRSTGKSAELTQANPLQLQTVSAWKIEVAADVQTLLAKQVGPVARVMLKNALAVAEHLDDLCATLSLQIPTEKGRKEFTDGVHRIKNKLLDRTTLSGAGFSSFSNPTASLASNPSGLGPAKISASPPAAPVPPINALERDLAETILTHFVGPIAKILLRKACDQTTIKTEIVLLLAEHIPSPAERSRFMQQINKALSI